MVDGRVKSEEQKRTSESKILFPLLDTKHAFLPDLAQKQRRPILFPCVGSFTYVSDKTMSFNKTVRERNKVSPRQERNLHQEVPPEQEGKILGSLPVKHFASR
jgi:hypothetical protein